MAYVIGEKCIACHYCKTECPVKAIDFRGKVYQIDPEKCIGCGLCAGLCPIAVIDDTDDPRPEPLKHGTKKLSCDVAVCGAGGSGLVAAVKLTELGHKVIVVEKAKKAGGDTNFAHGFRILGSRACIEELGLPDVSAQTIDYKYEQVKGEVDYQMVKDFLLCSGRFFDWMWEMPQTRDVFEGGYFMREPTAMMKRPAIQNLNSRDRSIGPGWAGSFSIVKMLEKCAEYGIEILYERRVSELVQDGAGAVCGIAADAPGGKVEIGAKAVILATGSCAHDDKRLGRLCPAYVGGEVPVYKQVSPTNTGDALYMAEAIGAGIDEANIDIGQNGPMHYPYSYTVGRLMETPECLQINLNGRRFQSETSVNPAIAPWLPHVQSDGGILSKQPKCMSYTVMDETILEKRGKELIDNPPDFDEHIMAGYRDEVAHEVELGYPAKKSDTLEGLALEMGIDPKALIAEIERYNGFCESGRDEDFGKDSQYLTPVAKPPFYAFFGQRFSDQATGGLMVDGSLRVLDNNGAPIPGLYGAGSTTQGANRLGGVVVTGGLTWALGSGYLAAEKIHKSLI